MLALAYQGLVVAPNASLDVILREVPPFDFNNHLDASLGYYWGLEVGLGFDLHLFNSATSGSIVFDLRPCLQP